MQQALALFEPGNTAIYLMAILLGLYVQYQAARTNGRTAATTFWDYWLKETPGMSLATVVVLVTVAGATIQSGMLAAMTGWAVFSMGFLKGFGFDALIQAPAPAAAAAPKQAGFARIGPLAVLAALSIALAGCAWMSGKSAVLEVPAEKSLPALGQKAQTAVNAANAALATVYTFVRDGLRDGTLATPDARRIQDQADKYSAEVDRAQELIKAGGFDAAQAKAAATQQLIKILHDQAVAAAQRRSALPFFEIPLLQGA